MQRSPAGHARRRPRLLASLALIALALASAALVSGEGSGTIFRGADPGLFRSHLEWRTGTYGGGDSPDFTLLRRTLLRVFARPGESILLGSSAVGVSLPNNPEGGDIRVFTPGAVTGPIGQEVIPALAGAASPPQQGAFANGFSCSAQRAAAGDDRGRITSRDQELAGPLPNPDGYAPCVYTVPPTAAPGIYSVVFTGPSGDSSNVEPQVSGQRVPIAADFGPSQRTAVTAWDVTVRAAGVAQPGRLFTYYYAGNTGGGGRPLAGESFVVTQSGFRYRVLFGGDPFGFVFYANQLGFQNSDGTPLYRNLMADPGASFDDQNQLRELQGGTALLPPTYPIFAGRPDPLVLDALGIPRTPVAPRIQGFTFAGPGGGPSTGVAEGGTFSFSTTQGGVFYVVVSRDGRSFDPTAPQNRALRGVAAGPGPITVPWDGRDNAGAPFPGGSFSAAAAIQGGEVHFPALDVENNVAGGPELELENPPDRDGDGVGDCPPWNGGCFGAFYDDRGYRAANGTLVGTAVNGNLCPGDTANPRGFGNPPLIPASDPLLGFDSRTAQRAFGFPFDANPSSICRPDGGFGDKKGLDLWTYYPSNVLITPLQIVDPTAVTLRRFTASRDEGGVVVRWETGVELGARGFHLLRSVTGAEADAVHVTARLIPARGSASEGAAYSWTDATATNTSTTYSYWLEELETSGATRRYGPARTGAGTAERPFSVALPLVLR